MGGCGLGPLRPPSWWGTEQARPAHSRKSSEKAGAFTGWTLPILTDDMQTGAWCQSAGGLRTLAVQTASWQASCGHPWAMPNSPYDHNPNVPKQMVSLLSQLGNDMWMSVHVNRDSLLHSLNLPPVLQLLTGGAWQSCCLEALFYQYNQAGPLDSQLLWQQPLILHRILNFSAVDFHPLLIPFCLRIIFSFSTCNSENQSVGVRGI